MRKLLTILLLLPMLVHAGKIKEVRSFWSWEDMTLHWIMSNQSDSLTIRYTEYSTMGEYAPSRQMRFWTNYTWSTANGNILINRTNYPTLTANDTVFIPAKTNGWRSFTPKNLNSGAPNQYICIYWQTGAYIAPTVSTIGANSLDSLYGVKIYGFTMNDHIDPAFVSFSNGHFSKYVWFDSCIFRGMNGFFPSIPLTLTTPNFTGDTSNCFYMWRFSRCNWDSLVGANSGNCALRFGGIALNNFWLHVEIDNCSYGDYSSKNNPASYIQAYNTYGLYIHDDIFYNLGVVDQTVGHTQCIWTEMCYFEIYNCWFGSNNLGDCIRNMGGADIPSMAGLFATWSVAYNGRSRVYNCVDVNSRKYPFLETRTDPGDTATLSPYVRMRTNPEVWFISGKSLFICLPGNLPYVNSIIDCYSTDTAFVKGSYATGPIDTVWNVCGAGSTHEGCNLFIHQGSNPIAVYDTAFNSFTEFAKNTGIDSNTLQPIAGGFITRRVTSWPSYITDDYYHVARVGPQPSGAITGLLNQLPRRPGAKNRWKN
jgi:hypothetical protein